MVFVWSNLVKGQANFTLTQVALNDVIMVFAFATVVGALIEVPLMLAVVRAVNASKGWYEANVPAPDARSG